MAFVYEPLLPPGDQIRLLCIDLSKDADAISCDLKTYTASSCPQYCAISYCWGKADESTAIRINECHFVVRRNLWNLLWHLKTARESRLLWIDAICIDQSSVEERNHQVGMMSLIYTRANSVISWLGPWTLSAGTALQLMKDSLIFWQDVIPEITRGPDGDFLLNKSYKLGTFEQARSLRGTYAASLADFARFCQAEYWHRTWIVQEVLLGSKIDLMCGDQHIPWDVLSLSLRWFRRTWELFDRSREDLDTIIRALPFNFTEQRSRPQPTTLSNLLRTYQATRCADPRDKVYAMLGLAVDYNSSTSLSVDYGKSIESLYCEVLHFCRDIPTENLYSFAEMLEISLDVSSRLKSTSDSHESITASSKMTIGQLCGSLSSTYSGRKTLVAHARLIGNIREIVPNTGRSWSVIWESTKDSPYTESTVSMNLAGRFKDGNYEHMTQPFEITTSKSQLTRANLDRLPGSPIDLSRTKLDRILGNPLDLSPIEGSKGDSLYQILESKLAVVAREFDQRTQFVCLVRMEKVLRASDRHQILKRSGGFTSTALPLRQRTAAIEIEAADILALTLGMRRSETDAEYIFAPRAAEFQAPVINQTRLLPIDLGEVQWTSWGEPERGRFKEIHGPRRSPGRSPSRSPSPTRY